MHHYPFHVGDYVLKTAHLPPLADLAYRRLLDLYYMEEGPIPNKPKWVANRIRMESDEAIIGFVLREFFELRGTGIGGFWHNNRADKVISKYQKKAATARENGAHHVAGTKKEPKSDADRTITRTKNHINTPLPPEGVAAFDSFWALYPNKGSKPQALKSFAVAVYGTTKRKARVKQVQLLAGLQRHLTCVQWTKDGGQFVPLAATWLNNDRWNDEPVQPTADGAGSRWWQGGKKPVLDKGIEFGLPAPTPNDDSIEGRRAWYRFQASVWVAAGDGPWWDAESLSYPIAKRLRDGDGEGDGSKLTDLVLKSLAGEKHAA